MTSIYPRSLAGLFHVNFADLILTPIRMVDTKPSDQTLKEIRFENGEGIAEFDDGYLFILNVLFDDATHSYTFQYKDADHIFDIKSDLSGSISSSTNIISFTAI
jgi:hypothetical protein